MCLYFIQHTQHLFLSLQPPFVSYFLFYLWFLYSFFTSYACCVWFQNKRKCYFCILWREVTNDLHCNVELWGKRDESKAPCRMRYIWIVGAIRSISYFFLGVESEEFSVLLRYYWCCENSFKSFILHTVNQWIGVNVLILFILLYAGNVSMLW